MDDQFRQRGVKQKLRVTMPNGNVICHNSATLTFLDVLKELGAENYEMIKTENCHLPLLSKEIYPQYEDWMKPLGKGWYVNTQSDTRQKYMQLVSIKSHLGINMEIELGCDFITSDKKVVQRSKKKDNKLLVKFPDGEYVGEENPIDTFINSIWKLGIEEIKRKGIEYARKPLITSTKQYNGQVQVDKDRWLVVPPLTKDKYKCLLVVGALLHQKLEVNII